MNTIENIYDINNLTIEQLNENSFHDSLFPQNSEEKIIENPMKTLPQIVNVVSTFQVNVELNLKKILMKAKNCEYNPKRFSALIMRISNPRTTALIFPKGKIVCTGAKSIEESKFASKKFAKILKKLGYDVRYSHFNIQNIVSTAKVHFEISLNRLALEHDELVTYNPESFPGLIYSIADLKMKALIFRSGNIVFLGSKEIELMNKAYAKLYQILMVYKITD